MIRIPYGISNFELLVTEGYIYIDRTHYLKELEQMSQRYLFMVRPRRFGKSLFLSVLEYYYGLQYKDKFTRLFGKYYIGQHPTPLANTYLILKFDFSQIDTSSFEGTFHGFLQNAKIGGIEFLGRYSQFFNQKDLDKVEAATFPSHVIQHIVAAVKLKAPNQKIYLLIDEYDHFANEILSFRFDDFNDMVGKNGFVRKFYEAIKVGTQSGIIDRLFITGVSPLTLDSLTSGFNIPTNISLDEEFSSMMGFNQEEVRGVLRGVNVPAEKEEEVMSLMKAWYNGYLFGKEAPEHIYNSDMVLYFAAEYSRRQRYPEDLLDPNIATDYTKIRRLFKIKGKEQEHLKYLDTLLREGEISAGLVKQYELERRFGRDDFISLLYYTGITTIDRGLGDEVVFKMPNYVIKQLYYQYFHRILVEESNLSERDLNIYRKIRVLAQENNFQPLVEYIQAILQELSVRDKRKFDERYIKIIFISALYNTKTYDIRSEYEVKKSPTEKGFVDILLLKRPPFEVKYQFVIELKYLKKEDAAKAENVKAEAIAQLKNYLSHDEYLQSLDQLRAYVVMFVGNKGEFIEVPTS